MKRREQMTTRELYDLMFQDYPDVVTVRDIKTMIGYCDKYVYNLIKAGKIRAFRYKKAYRATKLAVIEYLLNSEQTAQPSHLANI